MKSKRRGIPPKASVTPLKWDFSDVKPGDSIHAKTPREREAALIAFRYWVTRSKRNPQRIQMQAVGAYATSARVDHTDPDGEGYRVWFLIRKKDEV